MHVPDITLKGAVGHAIIVCKPGGLSPSSDPEGNTCNWTGYGLNTTLDQGFGGRPGKGRPRKRFAARTERTCGRSPNLNSRCAYGVNWWQLGNPAEPIIVTSNLSPPSAFGASPVSDPVYVGVVHVGGAQPKWQIIHEEGTAVPNDAVYHVWGQAQHRCRSAWCYRALSFSIR